LVGLETPSEEHRFDEEMEELSLLARTAGAEVVAVRTQKKKAPDQAYYIGKGKARELAETVQQREAELVIFNDELSPTQVRNLEALLGVKVVDRTALILDIFARRARTREGKLQVELAQLQYLLPRLIGKGEQLSRLGGGIGTRGPGETQLEVDRRVIRKRIGELRREINSLRRHRHLHRQKRKRHEYPLVSLVGYTNAGKSTLLNALTGAQLYTEDMLFATLDPSVRRGVLSDGRVVLFADTVGFIHRLPPQLWSAFQATLEEINAADLLLHVVDISHPDCLHQITAVRQHLSRLDPEYYRRELMVFNKLDRLQEPSVRRYLEREFPEGCFISALRGEGLPQLEEAVARALSQTARRIKLYLPYSKAALLYRIRRSGKVLEVGYGPRFLEVEAEVGQADAARLEEYRRPPAEEGGPESPLSKEGC
jgi:GTP-binding protein HflX